MESLSVSSEKSYSPCKLICCQATTESFLIVWIIFCFSSHPKIIIYLYLNDEKHLRKEGAKTDPYEKFKKLLRKGRFSHNPNDTKTQEWIRKQ